MNAFREMLDAVPLEFQEPRLALAEEGRASEDAFAALVRRQTKFVFRVAYAVLRNTADAEDAVQETFLKLYRLRRMEQMENERAYLARMAWRLAVDRLPKVETVEAQEITDSGQTPEQAAVQADWTATIHQLMDALPSELRTPLALSAVEELQAEEIAAMMGIPEGTVRRRVMRARQILKEKLQAVQAKAGRHAK